MEQYLNKGLDLLKEMNSCFDNKLSEQDMQNYYEGLHKFKSARQQLEKILNSPISLQEKKECLQLLSQLRKLYKELWKPLWNIQLGLIKVMDENGFGKGAE
jgi:hypothetical protein